jgi:methylglutaconyl-CoA hydratase
MSDPTDTPSDDPARDAIEEELPLVLNLDTDATSDLVRLEGGANGAVTVWINRPERRNAFDPEVIAALHQAFETLHGQDGVRVVFLRGVGGVFSAGADLEWMREAAVLTEADNHEDAMDLARMLKALHDLRPLTVALVEGPAFGGGAGLVAACDLAIATADAKLAFSEVKLGLIPATVAPYVVAAVGPRTARALFATARILTAEAARGLGLVHEVEPDARALDAAAARIAAGLRACAPGAVGDAKRLAFDVWAAPLDHALMEDTARRIAHARVSAEGREGVAAFLEKRPATWTQS